MKREMKSSIYKKIVFLLLIVIFSGCTLFQKKESTVATPEQVLTSIILDDSYRLNKYLIDGFPLDYETPDGKSLLILILESNSLKSLDLILTKDIEIDKKDRLGRTPIFYSRSIEALEKLVRDGANLNVIDNNGEPMLVYFIKNKPIAYSEYLASSGIDFELKDKIGWNSVFWSGVSGSPELVKKMIESGANFITVDGKGNYPVYYVYDEGILLELLDLPKYDIKKRNRSNENILGEVYLRAVANGYISVVDKLLSLGVNINYISYGDNAMDIAKESNNKEMIKYLQNKGLK